MCIYYKGRDGLTYNQQEHILPAGLGGKTKLPKGFVSDQFNNDISKLEEEVMRGSLIALARQFEGPGKRGKLGEKHETKSKVLLTADEENNYFSLCYLQKSRFIEIPFLEIYADTGLTSFHLPAALFEDGQKVTENFKANLDVPEKLKVKRLNDERIPVGRILFTVMPRNDHSNGTIAKAYYTYETHDGKFRKHYDCTFEPCRKLQKAIVAVMKTGAGYKSYFPTSAKYPVTNIFKRKKKYRKTPWRIAKAERDKKDLDRYLREEYNEFDFTDVG